VGQGHWELNGMVEDLPGLVNVKKKLMGKSPCYYWVNQLFRLGNVQ
jgi:hypothetical protein